MAKDGSINAGWRSLTSDSEAGNGFTPATEWMECGAITEVRCPYEVRNRTGSLELIPAIQLVDDIRESSPTVVNIGTTWGNANGVHDTDSLDVSSYTDDNQLMRFGWVTRNADGTGSSLSSCEVTGTFQYVGYTRSPDILLDWDLVCADDANYVFFPATQWYPIETARRYRATIEMAGSNGSIQVYPARQLAVDPVSPGGVATAGGGVSSDGFAYPSLLYHITTANVDDYQYIRFGWYVRRLSGTGFTWAAVRARFERMRE